MHGCRCGPGCYPVFILPFPWRCFGPCVRSDTTAALWHCKQQLRRDFLSPPGFFPRGSILTMCIKILSFFAPGDLPPRTSPYFFFYYSLSFFVPPLPSLA